MATALRTRRSLWAVLAPAKPSGRGDRGAPTLRAEPISRCYAVPIFNGPSALGCQNSLPYGSHHEPVPPAVLRCPADCPLAQDLRALKLPSGLRACPTIRLLRGPSQPPITSYFDKALHGKPTEPVPHSFSKGCPRASSSSVCMLSMRATIPRCDSPSPPCPRFPLAGARTPWGEASARTRRRLPGGGSAPANFPCQSESWLLCFHGKPRGAVSS